MGTIFLYILLCAICLASLTRPWVGAIGYYVYALLSPQSIWFWIFNDLNVSKMLAVATLLGFCFSALQGKINYSNIRHRQNYSLMIIWGMIHVSNMLTPFPNFSAGIPVTSVLSTLNTVMILYFVSQFLFTTQKQLTYLFYALLATGIYYVYWANRSYLTGEMWLYSTTGRLRGPMGSIYEDENAFALIFVISMPLILFYALGLKNKLYKVALLCVIPLLWHAVFLTGSRGALIAMAASLLYSQTLIKSKTFNVTIICGLIAALIYQGGELLNRTEGTMEKSASSSEEPLDPRLLSWEAGIKMIRDYPIFGVGTEKFQAAYPRYMDGKTHVAHNTFFQFAANNGLLTGILYFYLFFSAAKTHKKVKSKVNPNSIEQVINDGSMASLVGFLFLSIFLDLMIFESFYYLLLISIIKDNLVTSIQHNTPTKNTI